MLLVHKAAVDAAGCPLPQSVCLLLGLHLLLLLHLPAAGEEGEETRCSIRHSCGTWCPAYTQRPSPSARTGTHMVCHAKAWPQLQHPQSGACMHAACLLLAADPSKQHKCYDRQMHIHTTTTHAEHIPDLASQLIEPTHGHKGIHSHEIVVDRCYLCAVTHPDEASQRNSCGRKQQQGRAVSCLFLCWCSYRGGGTGTSGP